MDKYFYSAASLDRAIHEFEGEYGMSSEDFHALYSAGAEVAIPRFTQHVWASFYEDVLRMTGGAGVERQPIMTRVGQALTCA